jgi:hypothetical protein
MTYVVSQGRSEHIDNFVKSLKARGREIAKDYMRIPNSPEFQPEMLDLILTYGNELTVVTRSIEKIRKELDLDYDILRVDLCRRLYK